MILKRKGVKYILPLSISVLIMIIFFSVKNLVSANTINLKIETSPSSSFMVVDQMAPGDEQMAILRVKNTGDVNFLYSISSSKQEGSDALYNLLTLKIKDGNSVIADTYLKDLNNLSLGELAVNSSKDIIFIVKLPIETQNDLQGKATEVKFTFIASAQGGEYQPPVDPPVKDIDPYKPDQPKSPVIPVTPEQPVTPTQPAPPVEPNNPTQPIEQLIPNNPEPITPLHEEPSIVDPTGIDLPNTSSSWYNILLVSGIALVGSLLLLWRVFRVKRLK